MKTAHQKILIVVGLALSVALWGVMFINQLNIRHDCLPEDGMCNGGNTVIGDAYWALLLTLIIIIPVWTLGLAIYFGARKLHQHTKQ